MAAFQLSCNEARAPKPITLKPFTLKPIILKTQMNVKNSDPTRTHFLHVKTSKDGKPIGIIVKRRDKLRKKNPREALNYSHEVQEIIGVRVPDSPHDERFVYRNAKIVNNKLIMKTLSLSEN